MSDFWSNKRVCVTGGAALIGSHLVEELLKLNPKALWVVDDMSSGKQENLPPNVPVYYKDLRDDESAETLYNANIVFHLAAAHGGRAFVDTHDVECYDNFDIDTTVYRLCAESKHVEKVVYMSSACAYDTSIQQDVTADLKLSESMIDYAKPIVPDGAYGEQKYVSEKILRAYAKRGAFKGVAVRGFTVYGKRVSLTHFIGAAIARTMIHQDPLVIFGDGNQKRNWTFASDTARGLILAAEKMDEGVVNIGTEEANTPNTVYPILWDLFGWQPKEIQYQPNHLVGTANRIADASKARELLGWTPQYDIRRGLAETVAWFKEHYTVDELQDHFEQKLFER